MGFCEKSDGQFVDEQIYPFTPANSIFPWHEVNNFDNLVLSLESSKFQEILTYYNLKTDDQSYGKHLVFFC